MRRRSIAKWVFAMGALALAAGPAGAQSSGEAPLPAADAEVGFQRKTTLTPEEQLVESGKHLTRMQGAATGIRKMLAEARRQRDVVKTLCLNDKLSQIDVAVRTARDRRAQLEAAIKRRDAEQSNHEFTILTVLRQRSEQLVAEANQCIGEESAFIGDTEVGVEIDPQIAPDEAPYPSTDPTLVIEPPQCTSCAL